ncbi:hypothetical protein SAMN05421736_11546 [Evansella caseinilytica]|uniref:Uncharacterized protein n=1 Tax=Evansella caseinilytica TaxID=1503961 RepID=A0A1H3TKE6_9BACI|nr:hypothetical protein [Evansella caseinilytica]SDZ50753.1 hypothetical protein SAMN05421736_11546 [Evansella caseinilytica]
MFLNKLSEKDFVVLRGPFVSGRQNLNSIAGILILSIFLQALMFFLTYVVAGDRSIFPHIDILFHVHLYITGGLCILSLVYAIPFVFVRQQKLQYLISILVSQNIFGVFPLLMALFYIGKNNAITEGVLLNFTFTILLLGLLVFIATSIRFIILLNKGAYRQGSKKDQLRTRAEAGIKSFMPMIILASVSLLYLIQFVVRNFGLENIFDVVILAICILLFLAMLFVLPEQLVILYCKFRFESFNFQVNGVYLNPLQETEETAGTKFKKNSNANN